MTCSCRSDSSTRARRRRMASSGTTPASAIGWPGSGGARSWSRRPSAWWTSASPCSLASPETTGSPTSYLCWPNTLLPRSGFVQYPASTLNPRLESSHASPSNPRLQPPAPYAIALLAAAQLLAKDHRARTVSPMELKDVLGEIESDGANLVHERLLEWALTPPLWHADAAGGRPHHQALQARVPELDLIFGLPSGPAACEPHQRPHTCQHPTTCHTALEDFSCS